MQTLRMMGLRRRAALALAVVVLAVAAPMAALAAPSAAVVMDARSGEILFARNHDTRLHPASLTKMMTVYIAFEAIRNGEITLDSMVRISANAAGEPCSCLGLRAGQTIALRHLIRAAAVRSGNDAATAIGEAISGSEAAFIDRMNRTARALGMTNTTFRNAHGLTAPGHLSTARDMTILGRQLYFDFPQYYNLFSRPSADAGVATVVNTNRAFLGSYRGADGIKTGFTRAAGFNLTASAERNGVRLIVTVFGGQSVPDRTRRVTELMDLGFDRAPARVAVRPPPPPNYGGQQPGAAALAAASSSERPAAGRTLRVNRAVARSPIPLVRPRPGQPFDDAPEALLAALEQGVDAALEATHPVAAAVPALVPEPRPDIESVPFAIAGADPAPESDPDPQADLAELAEEADPLSAAAVLPFDVVEGAPATDTEVAEAEPGHSESEVAESDVAQDQVTEAEDSALAVAQAPMPPARPDTLAAAETLDDDAPEAMAALGEVAAPAHLSATATPADSASPGPDATAVAQADAARAAPRAAVIPPVERYAPGVASSLPAAALQRSAAAQPAPAQEDAVIVLTFSADSAPDAAPMLAALAEAGRAEPAFAGGDTPRLAAGTEVLERQLSTSSPRLWRISLGRFGTRDAAERALMRAGLAELASLDGALRRVERGQSGFEATFVGLSERQALMACDRLRARDRDCSTLAP